MFLNNSLNKLKTICCLSFTLLGTILVPAHNSYGFESQSCEALFGHAITRDPQLQIWALEESDRSTEAAALEKKMELELQILPVTHTDTEKLHQDILNSPIASRYKEYRSQIAKSFAKQVANSKDIQPKLIILSNGLQGVWKPWKSSKGTGANEIAAYKIDQLLGLHLVPVTVERALSGVRGTLQLYIDNSTLGTEVNLPQLNVLDSLLNNGDRNWTNYLIKDGRLIAIDNGLSLDFVSSVSSLKEKGLFLKDIFSEIMKNGPAQEIKTLKFLQLRLEEIRQEKGEGSRLFQFTQNQVKAQEKRVGEAVDRKKNQVKKYMPKYAVYLKLKAIADPEWVQLLAPYLSQEQIRQFLERKKDICDILDLALDIYGRSIFD